MYRLCRLSCIIVSFVLLTNSNVHAQEIPEFWYEDNNMNTAGGYPPDFAELFRQPDKWSSLREKISVYLVRGNTLNNIISKYGESFVTDTMAPVLASEDIKLAIDNPGNNLQYIYNLMKSNGVTISHVGLQSTLSKPKPESPRYDPELQVRINEVKSRILSFHQFAPDVKCGIIDARPTKGWEYKDAYKRLYDALDSTAHKLDFILLDCPYSYPNSGNNITWEGIKEAEKYIKEDLAIEFGLIITDNVGGMDSDTQFYNKVMSFGEDYIKTGTRPDYFVLMSWFHHPSQAFPEDAPAGSYPMTKVGLELFSYLESSYQTLTSIETYEDQRFSFYQENNSLVFENPIHQYAIYNLSGSRIIYSGKINSTRISLNNLKTGIYIVSTSSERFAKTFKIYVP